MATPVCELACLVVSSHSILGDQWYSDTLQRSLLIWGVGRIESYLCASKSLYNYLIIFSAFLTYCFPNFSKVGRFSWCSVPQPTDFCRLLKAQLILNTLKVFLHAEMRLYTIWSAYFNKSLCFEVQISTFLALNFYCVHTLNTPKMGFWE